MFIYLIKNTINHLSYIGYHQGANLLDRWYGHLRSVKEGSKTYLHNSMRKYPDKFSIIPIWSGFVSLTELKLLEVYYIKSFNTKWPNGYNMTEGGEGVCSERMKEVWTRPEYRAKMRNRPKPSNLFKRGYSSPRKGGHREDISLERRQEMSRKAREWQVVNGNPRQGICHSQQTKDKISASNRGKTPHNKHSDETCAKAVNLCASDISQDEVSKMLGISQSSVSEILRKETQKLLSERL